MGGGICCPTNLVSLVGSLLECVFFPLLPKHRIRSVFRQSYNSDGDLTATSPTCMPWRAEKAELAAVCVDRLTTANDAPLLFFNITGINA